jgi:predicted nucleic acid-binding protein
VVKIVVDTYAWIELLIDSEKGGRIKEIFENAEKVYTPSTVLAETARKFLREGIDEKTIVELLLLERSRITNIICNSII